MNHTEFKSAIQQIIGIPPNNTEDGWTLSTPLGYLLVSSPSAPDELNTVFLRFADGARPGFGENLATGQWHIKGGDFSNDPEAVLKELVRRLARCGYVPPGPAMKPDPEMPEGLPELPEGARYVGLLEDLEGQLDGWVFAPDDTLGWGHRRIWEGEKNLPATDRPKWHFAEAVRSQPQPPPDAADLSNASVKVCNASLAGEYERLREKARRARAAYQTEYMQVGMKQLADAYEDAAALLESRIFTAADEGDPRTPSFGVAR